MLSSINRLRYKTIKSNHYGPGEPALQHGRTIVVDIGKTHARVSLWSDEGLCLEKLSRANRRSRSGPYPVLDTAATADWLIQCLGRFSGHPVAAIVPVAHGAAVVGIRGGVLAFSPPDYEWDLAGADLAAYRAARDPFALTGSPALPQGLNLGAQLHALEALLPGGFDGVTLMPYAQYWAWLLSGVAVSEVTSLGCHTDLWAPAAGDFSPMAVRRGWAGRFAPMAGAGEAIGALLPDIAALTGLSPKVRIHAGLHDSNAALHAARAFPQLAGEEASVLSTGTWFIGMRRPGQPVDFAQLPEHRDCLVNVDVFARPVPSARWMGGRELELLGAAIDHPATDGAAQVLASDTMLLPCQVSGCGPFPAARPRWIDEPAAPARRNAAIALYAALMADVSLDLIGARRTLLIEGRFARSAIFTRALAALRPGTQVWTAASEADVSFGALRLAHPGLAPVDSARLAEPLAGDLAAYRSRWLDRIEGAK